MIASTCSHFPGRELDDFGGHGVAGYEFMRDQSALNTRQRRRRGRNTRRQRAPRDTGHRPHLSRNETIPHTATSQERSYISSLYLRKRTIPRLRVSFFPAFRSTFPCLFSWFCLLPLWSSSARRLVNGRDAYLHGIALHGIALHGTTWHCMAALHQSVPF